MHLPHDWYPISLGSVCSGCEFLQVWLGVGGEVGDQRVSWRGVVLVLQLLVVLLDDLDLIPDSAAQLHEGCAN